MLAGVLLLNNVIGSCNRHDNDKEIRLQSRRQGDARYRTVMWHLSPPCYQSASSPGEQLSNHPTSRRDEPSGCAGAEGSSALQRNGPVRQKPSAAALWALQ